MAEPVPVITGPTATGKTRLAIAVAERVGGEVISMDSRQVFRGMDIGTAKATMDERRGVPHHGLDLVDPDTRYSAGRFARDARRWIRDILGRGRVPILAGGTGFFLRALTHPLFDEPPIHPERRHGLHRYLADLTEERLRAWIETLDPAAARRLRAGGGRQRVLRALEIALLTGRPIGWWHETHAGDEPPLDAAIFVLDLPRPTLYGRIDARVDAMVEAGLVDEVRALLDQGFGPDDPGMSATGYPEIGAFVRGEVALEEAMDRIRRDTRRYARRQLTWFRNQLPPGAVRIDATRPLDQQADEVVRQWRNAA